MNRFLLGLVLGALSGAVTYLLSHDTAFAAGIALIAAILTWLRVDTFIFGSGD
ncbi:hypothetical protein ACLF6K_05915 [Streptomyces xanthophaeus]|uniref:hypothetical protein n=1 Tax=Streptomyces xanthophaeus TaxID=67385 RepID=UPI00398FF435